MITTITFESFMPARCWIAPEMPTAMYNCGAAGIHPEAVRNGVEAPFSFDGRKEANDRDAGYAACVPAALAC
ncbi:hypothetical protein [Burkholderia pyrrocinia]|uniref:hypothetical protein n=1 Tax=Burkholderia pyrrocinia TaxID=60550 RepID=UPI003D767A81